MGIENGNSGNNEETGRRIEQVASRVVEETKEPTFDLLIAIALGHVPSVAEIDSLNTISNQERDFAERLQRTQEYIDAFLKQIESRFQAGRGHRARIREALSLMLKMHADQNDRADTALPFLAHPIAVANDVLDMVKESVDDDEARDLCIAALLHDSVEDQSRLLAYERRLASLRNVRTPEALERSDALGGLGWLFGARVLSLVQKVTTPLAGIRDASREEKNVQYQKYIRAVFNDQDAGPAVIKWADLKQNALTIHLIRKRAEEARAKGDDEEADRLLGFYNKLKVKYEPALEEVQVFFQDITFRQHPLYSEQEHALEEIQQALEGEYAA